MFVRLHRLAEANVNINGAQPESSPSDSRYDVDQMSICLTNRALWMRLDPVITSAPNDRAINGTISDDCASDCHVISYCTMEWTFSYVE